MKWETSNYSKPVQLRFPASNVLTTRADFNGGVFSTDLGPDPQWSRPSEPINQANEDYNDQRHPSYIGHRLIDLMAHCVYQSRRLWRREWCQYFVKTLCSRWGPYDNDHIWALPPFPVWRMLRHHKTSIVLNKFWIKFMAVTKSPKWLYWHGPFWSWNSRITGV